MEVHQDIYFDYIMSTKRCGVGNNEGGGGVMYPAHWGSCSFLPMHFDLFPREYGSIDGTTSLSCDGT